MFYDTGCYGRVVVGPLPEPIASRLTALPGDWLEFEPGSGAIVVRHIQPSSSPCLPTIAAELVRMLSELPPPEQQAIEGGELLLHTEATGQLVRLRVEAGGAVRIEWAQPDFRRAERKLYDPEDERLPGAPVQCLHGCLNFETPAASRAVREIETLCDNFEGLYPEGEFVVLTDEAQKKVQMRMNGLNLDVHLLIECAQRLAIPGTLFGRIEVSSFAARALEQCARFLFEDGRVYIQRPVLWEADTEAAAPGVLQHS